MVIIFQFPVLILKGLEVLVRVFEPIDEVVLPPFVPLLLVVEADSQCFKVLFGMVGFAGLDWSIIAKGDDCLCDLLDASGVRLLGHCRKGGEAGVQLRLVVNVVMEMKEDLECQPLAVLVTVVVTWGPLIVPAHVIVELAMRGP
jgi:hypothetical protein